MSSDQRWFEIETLSTDAWREFWTHLGVADSVLVGAWRPFTKRYAAARCDLPEALHSATRARTINDLLAIALKTRMSMTVVRTTGEVLAEAGVYPDRASLTVAQRRPASTGLAWRTAIPVVSRLPLEGLTVVEATSRIQGPLAGRLLAALGASVIRVEPPGGDVARMVAPLAGDTGAFFLCMNRAKTAVELDLAKASGREQLEQLVSTADVFIHNWRPGKADEWNLGSARLVALNPSLVYCEASGWGKAPPPASPIGMDYLVQAHAGLGNFLARGGDPPLPSKLLLADVMGSICATEGVLRALWLRGADGRGRVVHSSLLTGVMALQHHCIMRARRRTRIGSTVGNQWKPWEEPVRSADGWFAVEVGSSARAHELARWWGERAEVDLLSEGAAREVAGCTTAECVRGLADRGFAASGVCQDLTGLPADPMVGPALEPIGGSGHAPQTPWEFTSG